jgi:hypothetical protein
VKANLKHWKYLDKLFWTDGKKTGYKFAGWLVEDMARFNELTSTITEHHNKPPYTAGVEGKLKDVWARHESARINKMEEKKTFNKERMKWKTDLCTISCPQYIGISCHIGQG